MMKRYETLKNWNEDIAPETKFKKTKIIEALPNLYKYLKETFILKNIDLDKKTDVFIDDYQKHTLDKSSKQAIGRLLTKINITPIKLSGNAGYKYKKTNVDPWSKKNPTAIDVKKIQFLFTYQRIGSGMYIGCLG